MDLLPFGEVLEFCRALSIRECVALDRLIQCDLRRRGFRRFIERGQWYDSTLQKIVSQLVQREADLDEIANEIEAMDLEIEMEAA